MSRNLRLWKKDCRTWQEALMRQNGTPGKRTKENSFVTYCVGRKSETRMKNKGIRNSSWDWGGQKTKCRWKTQWERLRVPGGARREYWDSQSWDWTTLGQGVDGMKIKGCRLVEKRTDCSSPGPWMDPKHLVSSVRHLWNHPQNKCLISLKHWCAYRVALTCILLAQMPKLNHSHFWPIMMGLLWGTQIDYLKKDIG